MADGKNSETDKDRLKRFVAELVDLEERRLDLAIDIKRVYDAAKEAGHGKKVLRDVVKRKMETAEERSKREVFELNRDQMLAALGMISDLPLGKAAIEAAPARRKESVA